MNITLLNKEDLREKLFTLQDTVATKLSMDPDVDNFLDTTNLFDQWEAVLPDAEYPIFVMAVLNNIRRNVVIDVILNSLLDNSVTPKRPISNKDVESIENTDHPFC
ncbi:MAG: hypothetical protein VX600_01600 [Candidatus Neomarinimicrobiota bacterium]|nr:hypothetical protein [Candidatus Neomarinimicrobiota bacterium]|tara:strand:- start:58 stop:375 length:318 start_codon:yes stop_codon:yes gene_type:complete